MLESPVTYKVLKTLITRSNSPADMVPILNESHPPEIVREFLDAKVSTILNNLTMAEVFSLINLIPKD